MLSFAFIAPALFFLPGFTAFSGNYIRNTSRTVRRGQVSPTVATVFAWIVISALLVHTGLLAIILAASSGLTAIGWDASLISWPYQAITGKANLSLTQLVWILFYCLFAAIVGFLLGYSLKNEIYLYSIEGFNYLAKRRKNLHLIAYVYLYTSSSGEDCEGGYVGVVAGHELTAKGVVSWIQLIEPSRFTVKKQQPTDDLAELKEWKIGQAESEAPPTLMMLTADNFSHIIFTLFNSEEDEEDEEDEELPADHGGRSIS